MMSGELLFGRSLYEAGIETQCVVPNETTATPPQQLHGGGSPGISRTALASC